MNATALPALPARAPHLKLALLLGAAGALATLALFPYLLTMLPMPPGSRLPPWAMAISAAVQSGVLAWLAAWLGLFLGARHGLDAPWLRAWVYRRPWPAAHRARWTWAFALGLLAGLMVPAIDWLGGHRAVAPALAPVGMAWRGALASFYGGIVEETLCRLLLVSLLVWALAKTNRDRARPWMFVAAILLGALLFGAGHLPAAFAGHLVDGPATIARIVLLNASVGVVFGSVFWRWGLEHAMLAHFAADLVLHVGLPLLGQGG